MKHGVATRVDPVRLGELCGRRREIFAGMRRNRVWALGLGVTLCGSPVSIQAVSLGDVSVVKPLMRVEVLFTALLGVWLLRERLAAREWCGVACLLAGAFALVLGSERSAPPATDAVASAALLGGTWGTAALLLAAERRWPGRVRYELAAPLGAGLLVAAADINMKLGIEAAAQTAGGFDIRRPAIVAALLATPHTWCGLAGDLSAFVLVQTAYTRGRVSVIGPVVGVGAILFTAVLAHALLGENLPAARATAIAAVVAGAALLSGRSEAPPDTGTRRGASTP